MDPSGNPHIPNPNNQLLYQPPPNVVGQYPCQFNFPPPFLHETNYPPPPLPAGSSLFFQQPIQHNFYPSSSSTTTYHHSAGPLLNNSSYLPYGVQSTPSYFQPVPYSLNPAGTFGSQPTNVRGSLSEAKMSYEPNLVRSSSYQGHSRRPQTSSSSMQHSLKSSSSRPSSSRSSNYNRARDSKIEDIPGKLEEYPSLTPEEIIENEKKTWTRCAPADL